MTINLESIIEKLSKSRPIFHSEADFQHSLAWEIHSEKPNSAIRLEYPVRINGQEGRPWYLDLFVQNDNIRYAIELKYATANLEETIEDEKYDLRNQSADDLMRYGFCYDIYRIEQMIQSGRADLGFAVIVSNYPPFWTIPDRETHSNHGAFRIHESRILHGKLEWGSKTAKSYQPPIALNGTYILSWRDFSLVEGKYGKFKYMAIPVSP